MKENEPLTENKPPLFSNWKSMYVFVLVLHALIIALMYLFTLNYQ